MNAERVMVPKSKAARLALTLELLFVGCLSVAAQSDSTVRPPSPEATTGISFKLVLEDGTPVQLRTGRTVSSADADIGDLVDFEVMHDVQVKGITVIPRGSVAWGTVIEVRHKRRLGRGGRLNIKLDSVQLVHGNKAALRSMKAGARWRPF
jgi:hypothetical protein